MLPVISSRCYYFDGEIIETEGDSPPKRLTGIEMIIYRHPEGLRTLSHGEWEGYWWLGEKNGVWLESGPSMDDADWEALYNTALITR